MQDLILLPRISLSILASTALHNLASTTPSSLLHRMTPPSTSPFDEADQEKIFALLNKECLEKFGKGCDGLLEEARSQMRDVDVSFSPEEE